MGLCFFQQVEFREDHIANAQVRDTRSKKIELSSLRPNQTYAISVRAGNSYGFGDASPEIKVQTLTNEGLQPANVSAVALNSSVSLHRSTTSFLLSFTLSFFFPLHFSKAHFLHRTRTHSLSGPTQSFV